MTAPATVARPSVLTAALRGAGLACPACGRGRLLRGYLAPVEACSACGERYGHLRADDAPPWMTILLVGHIVVPLLLTVEQRYSPPLWVQATLWPAVTLLLSLLLLPRCKGVILGVLWATRAGDDQRDEG